MTTYQGGKISFIQGPPLTCVPVNVDNDLVSECFTPDPSWSSQGSTSTDGSVIVNVNNDNAIVEEFYTTESEVWCEFKFSVDATPTMPSSGDHFSIGGVTDDGVVTAALGVVLDGATQKFNAYHRTDAGFGDTIIESPAFTAGQEYLCTIRFVAATAPAADDGIVTIWLDTTQVFTVTNLDSDFRRANRVMIGAEEMLGAIVATIRADNVFVGTTGTAPA